MVEWSLEDSALESVREEGAKGAEAGVIVEEAAVTRVREGSGVRIGGWGRVRVGRGHERVK